MTAFVCGFGMMALELLGSRLLQPAFGSSIDVWAAIICVFILSLSVGYVVGGLLADRRPGHQTLGLIIVGAGSCVLLLPVYARALIDGLGPAIHGARWGSLVAALLLFLPPSLLLGAVVPLLVQLAFTGPKRIGRTTGTVYAISSLGNVLGILVTDYVLLVRVSLHANLLGVGLLLGLTGLAHLLRQVPRPAGPRRSSPHLSLRGVSLVLVLAAAASGFALHDEPYRIRGPGLPSDEVVVAHRDSPYAHITWVLSESSNYLQMRFFNSVQGGICLRPRWDELPAGETRRSASPQARPLNPGPLIQTRYLCVLPVGVLLNPRLMREAQGAPRRARASILMAGLGSGAGVSVLAHHFPEAAMTVVEIDPAVIALVREHYPYLRALEQVRTRQGESRLRLVAQDARQFVRHRAGQVPGEDRYDLIILDAYGSGSMIPPHLMTREFFMELTRLMPPDGLLLVHIHGSLTGRKRAMLGGAIRTLRAAGWTSIRLFPVLLPEEDPASVDPALLRNYLVLASRQPIDPDHEPAGWERVHRFVLYPELPEGRWVSRVISLGDGHRYLTAQVPLREGGASLDEELVPALEETLVWPGPAGASAAARVVLQDPELIVWARRAVRHRYPTATPDGWETATRATELIYQETDAVRFAREAFRNAVEASWTSAGGSSTEPADEPLFTDDQPNADILNH